MIDIWGLALIVLIFGFPALLGAAVFAHLTSTAMKMWRRRQFYASHHLPVPPQHPYRSNLDVDRMVAPPMIYIEEDYE